MYPNITKYHQNTFLYMTYSTIIVPMTLRANTPLALEVACTFLTASMNSSGS